MKLITSLISIACVMPLLASAQTPSQPNTKAESKPMSTPTERKLDNGLRLIDQKIGEGPELASGKAISAHYTGWLYDPKAPEGKGKQFDSSVGRVPFGFIVGAGRVIKGWDLGVVGMKVDGKRTLIIPPELGYGERGAGGVIPPNATLIFDIELLKIIN
jgi:FKBP-type peptidyl-prolyl cis-trans isomerase